MGRGERSAGITERYISFFPLGNVFYQYLENPFLKPEKNYQIDLVYSYKSDWLSFHADEFYSRLKDFISSEISTEIKLTKRVLKDLFSGVSQII